MAIPAAVLKQIKSTLYQVNAPIRPLVREVLEAAAENGIDVTQNGKGIWYLWGKTGDPHNGEHYSGNGVDFMIRDKYDGDFIADYLWQNRSRFGLTHMIWRQRIKSTDRRYSPGQWVPMANRGNTTQNHMDHVHAFFDGDKGGAPGGNTNKPSVGKPATPIGGLSMADAAQILARIDSLQSAVQTMANALAGKIDYTNTTLNPDNKDGLQASVQKMANSLAQKADDNAAALGDIHDAVVPDCGDEDGRKVTGP